MIDAQTLLELSRLHLSTEQMEGVLRILARSEQTLEERRKLASARQKRYRDKKNNITHDSDSDVTNDVTRARDVETNNKLSQEENKNTPPCSPSKPKKTWETSAEFVELLAVFPPRSGDKDLKGSFNAFNAARKRETFPVIIDGAKRYRDHIDATGKMNTEYVRQIRTWLNKDGWKETYGQDRLSHTGNNTVSKGFNNIRDAINRRFGVEDARGDGGGGEIIDVLPGLRKGA